jgi:methyl-accepting chemotaxis protein
MEHKKKKEEVTESRLEEQPDQRNSSEETSIVETAASVAVEEDTSKKAMEDMNEVHKDEKSRKGKQKTRRKSKRDEAKIKRHGVKAMPAKLKDMLTYAGEKTLPLRRQIRFKLVIAFIVPVVFIVALGVFSYLSTKGTIVETYENSAKVNVDNSSQYMELLMEDIETKSSQVAGFLDFQFYYVSYDTNSVIDNNDLYNSSKVTMTNQINSSVGIYSIYAFGSKGKPMTTLSNALPESLYSDFSASEEGTKWTEAAKEKGGLKSTWMGYHAALDKGAGSSPDFYAATYIRNFAKGNGFIVYDLLRTKVEEVLSKSVVSDESIVAFVTPDGRETLASGDNKTIKENKDGSAVFFGKSFYQKAIEGESTNGKKYVTYEGSRHLFVYSKVGETGAVICTLIPESDILGPLNNIRNTTIILVLLASFIAIFIGLALSTDIAKVINKFSVTFKHVSAGDFTVRINTKRKDEFGLLAQDMDDMLSKIRELVADMANFGHNVSDAAIKVSGASEEILTSINEVSDTVNVMGQGVSEQAKDTEKSFLQMTDFAGQIGEACEDTDRVGQVANQTQQIVTGGRNIINELMQQVTSTSEVTSIIIKDIDDLQLQSKSIGSVVETINGIASTTNLLSLNASIEAARAGDAGRGFAVVAEQIRSLAEQSVDSVKRIESIIKSIQQKTQTTASSAKRTEQMLGLQTEALNNTVQVFQEVDKHMIDLLGKINHITGNMQTITVSKDEVLDAIKNIAAVTQQTLASSEVVSTNINTQISSVETLNLQAEEMKEKAKELEEAIAKFTI